jgi:hypothetical protein
LFFFLAGCVLQPAWQQIAREQDLESWRVDSERFRHVVLEKVATGEHLRIFVEGDGTPWTRQNRMAVDPTPTNPVLLRMLAISPGPAVYLGRPCYFGLATDKGCRPGLWTSDRYGQEVVDSMCSAANTISRARGATSVQLVGYSGGGAIVVGMRSCTERLVAITTVAANLTPERWTELHGYLPLDDLTPLAPGAAVAHSVSEVHWQCQDDLNVPPAITDEYFASNTHAVRRIIRDCTHAKGWERVWQKVLMQLP